MTNTFRNSVIELYKDDSIENLKEFLKYNREQFHRTQSEHDAVRCGVIYELIESKIKEIK